MRITTRSCRVNALPTGNCSRAAVAQREEEAAAAASTRFDLKDHSMFANDCRLERELKDIHILILTLLAWTPESPLGCPDQLLPWSWESRKGELVPLFRVVSYCPR